MKGVEFHQKKALTISEKDETTHCRNQIRTTFRNEIALHLFAHDLLLNKRSAPPRERGGRGSLRKIFVKSDTSLWINPMTQSLTLSQVGR